MKPKSKHTALGQKHSPQRARRNTEDSNVGTASVTLCGLCGKHVFHWAVLRFRWIPLAGLFLLALSLGRPDALKPGAAIIRPEPTQEVQAPKVRSSQLTLNLTQPTRAAFAQDVRFGQQGLTLAEAKQTATFISQAVTVPLDSPESFLALAAVWSAITPESTEAVISVRGSADGLIWGEWLELKVDGDSAAQPGERVSNLLFLDRQTRYIQYRLDLSSATPQTAPVLTGLRFSFISPGATPKQMLDQIRERSAAAGEEQAAGSSYFPRPPIASRVDWGCPDGESNPRATPQYTTVTHLIVHHTDTPNTASDWPAVVRSIWNFHIFTNGWNDIGYNYLIDPNGIIYEGRAGGDNVLGAHFSCANSNTMGTALLGTFITISPTAAALTSLKSLLAWKCDQRGIDPLGSAFHNATQLNLTNISGHRDANPSKAPSACPGTECPGDNLYAQLPAIRLDVKDRVLARPLANVSAASYSASALAPEAIIAAFGSELATTMQSAATTPLPTTLAGTRVLVKDSAGTERPAPLFFVSPGQINYQIPPGTAVGLATVTATSGNGRIAVGTIQVAAVAPALFSANADGQGVAAAVALRVKADGTQIYEPVATFDPAQNKFVSRSLDLSPPTDQVFLILFGTGIRYRSSLPSVVAKVGGVDAQVDYAGEQGGFVGLDQVNLRLPQSLGGRGEVDVVLTIDGHISNAVRVNIR